MTNLTEKFKKHELPKGFYYAKMPNGSVEILSDYALCRYALAKDGNKIKILSAVPSYNEFDALKMNCEFIHTCLKGSRLENARLKELLKEWVKAYPVVAVTCNLKNFVKIKELLEKTNEALK